MWYLAVVLLVLAIICPLCSVVAFVDDTDLLVIFIAPVTIIFFMASWIVDPTPTKYIFSLFFSS